jgi:pilus assembly protein Flp/PilA
MSTRLALLHLRTRAWMAERRERGAGLVEYALLIALIAMACILGVTALGTATSHKFSQVGSSLT